MTNPRKIFTGLHLTLNSTCFGSYCLVVFLGRLVKDICTES